MSKWMRSSFPSWSESYVDWTQPSPRIQSAVLAENTFCASPLTNVGSRRAGYARAARHDRAQRDGEHAPSPHPASPSRKLDVESRDPSCASACQLRLTSCRCLKLGEPHLHAADELGHPARLGLAQRLLQQRARPLVSRRGPAAARRTRAASAPRPAAARRPRCAPARSRSARSARVEVALRGGQQREEAVGRAEARGLADLHELVARAARAGR